MTWRALSISPYQSVRADVQVGRARCLAQRSRGEVQAGAARGVGAQVDIESKVRKGFITL